MVQTLASPPRRRLAGGDREGLALPSPRFAARTPLRGYPAWSESSARPNGLRLSCGVRRSEPFPFRRPPHPDSFKRWLGSVLMVFTPETLPTSVVGAHAEIPGHGKHDRD